MMAVPMEQVVRIQASSGTTGKQVVAGYTQHDLEIWEDICARQLVAAGGGPKDFVHVSYGYGLFTGGLGLHGGAHKIGATTIPVSSGNTQRQITILRDFVHNSVLYALLCNVHRRNTGGHGRSALWKSASRPAFSAPNRGRSRCARKSSASLASRPTISTA